MSRTFGIACKNCKEYLWIGQGWNKNDYHLYLGEKNTMELLRCFLWDHKKHNLIFEDTEFLLDYKEIE